MIIINYIPCGIIRDLDYGWPRDMKINTARAIPEGVVGSSGGNR